MLEPKHANAWFQWCNIPLFVFVVLFYDGIICLAFLILSSFDGQNNNSIEWLMYFSRSRAERRNDIYSPPFDDSQPGSRYPLCFADVSIDGWTPFRGWFATTRKWLWTSGFDVSVCRQRDHMLPPPASMAVGDSRICSPIWCLYCTDWRLRQIVLACTNYIQCMLGVVEERYAGGCTCLFFFQANFGMIQLMFFLGWSCETIS